MLKYQNKVAWAQVFARVLVGFLEDNPNTFRQFGLIVASPTYVSRTGGRSWDHTRRVIKLGYQFSNGAWPFDVADPPAIIKTAATPPMMKSTWRQREAIAENELRNVLQVPNPEKTSGKIILVYDDVFTDGFTLNEVARCLKQQGGAAAVCGVTLARQPWRSRG